MPGEQQDLRHLRREVCERAADGGDPLALLETAIVVAAEVGRAADALVEHYVGAARTAGSSWTVIGDRLGVSKQAARERFAHRVQAGELIGEATMVPRLAACVEVANAAAAEDDSVPGTQHLLLGLLHAGLAANVLDRLGVTRERIRAASTRLFEPVVITTPEGVERRVVGDGEADGAILGARRLAAERGQHEVRTEHVLFVVALDAGSAAGRVLNDLDIDRAQVKKELSACLPPPPRQRRLGKGRVGRACSFCGCADADRPMVSGPGVHICADCVELSTDVLRQRAGAR